jgi:tight adherence protein B
MGARDRRTRRLLATAGALVAALGLAASSAHADTPDPVTISAVQVDADTVTGILSVSQSTSVSVDNTSLTAVIAGRSYTVDTSAQTSLKRATMIAVDTSGSMGADGMATVRAAATTFLGKVPADVHVGLTSFSNSAHVVVAPTLDRAKLQAAVNALKSAGETSLYDGIVTAAKAMSSYGSRTMVLLSDGGDTASRNATATGAADLLRQESIWTAVVGFHTADSDNAVLSSFASASDGEVAAASSTGAVNDAFLASARALSSQITFSVTPGAEAADATKVVITGKAGGQVFQSETPITFASDAWPAKPQAPVVIHSTGGSIIPSGLSSTVLTVGLGAVALGVFGIVLALGGASLKSGRTSRVESIERYLAPRTRGAGSARQSAAPRAISQSLVQIGERAMKSRDSTPKVIRLIERADLPLRPGEWWVLRLVSVVLVCLVAMFFFGWGPIATPLCVVGGGLVGYLLPMFILKFLAKRRSKKFEAQLPDVLMLVASGLSTGFSLSQALDAIARDAAEPLAKEFSRALAETRIGADLGDALERMADRMESTNMRWTAMAIRIQREVGGNLGETLRTTAGTLREREGLERMVKTLSAEGKLSAYILIAMPIGVFLYLLKINHDYVAMLWTRPQGVMMLVAGLIFMGIGIVWMRKVVKVEV